MATIGSSLAFTAQRVPDAPALLFEERRLSYRELDSAVNRLARAFAARGLGRGDRCALVSSNSIEFVLSLYAASRLGAIVVPVNPRSAPPEIIHIVADSGAKVIVSEPAHSPLVHEALVGLADRASLTHLTLGPADHGIDALTESAALSSDSLDVVVDENDDALIVYTSGTTGLAKGVLMDHHRLIWAGISVCMGSAGINDGSCLLHVAPLYHSGQLNLMLLTGVTLGAKHVILKQFDPEVVVETIACERVTAFFGVPTMYQLMLDAQKKLQLDLSSWTTGFYGAAPMPADVAARIQKEIPHARIYSFYGQTEAGPNGLFSRPEEVVARPDVTAYRAAPMMAIKIVDQDGIDVAAGEVGEVLLRGESVMKGYWNNPAATAETLRDGWLHTGDLARFDADGGITIVDRLKDLIISGGRNVYSAEVELAVASHPAVADCAVVGRPHEVYGETVVAVVTLNPGEGLTIEELREHCSRLIADYKLPRELRLAAIPRNQSGKVLKREIRSELRAD
ncbi:AMP-binding protein [Rhodococcus sp. USK13]|uniref:class I adenylate-forming enzyme family protein n=1 Tax=Rhodococcus sp. USK13 TaxID=2806442 RepID=UPI001BCB3F37|nr:AMP-binding protein [Rhodococcus sp. USK13]